MRGWDLVGFLLDIDMRQDQPCFGVERMQHLGCLAIVEIVEASPKGFSIERDGTSRWVGRAVQETRGVLTKSLLDRRRIKALEDVTNAGMTRRALSPQTEGGVQATPMDLDEGFDRSEGVAARYHGEDRKQEDVAKRIDLPLRPAWVRDCAEQVEQQVE